MNVLKLIVQLYEIISSQCGKLKKREKQIKFQYLVGKNTASAGAILQARLVLPLHALGLLKPPDSHLTKASSCGVLTSPPCPAGRGGVNHTFSV